MHHVRVVIGGALSLALAGLSVACCYLFGTHLAPGNEGIIYGVLGGTADALKAILPLGITAAFASRQSGRAAIGIVLFIVFAIYSFASELGLYALSRDAQSSTANAGQEQYRTLKDERARIQDRLKALANARPAKTVKAELAGQFQSALWQSSSQCQDATASASRTFCGGISRVQAELATAEEAERLRAKDDELSTKLAGINLADALKSADPQSEALARMTGLSPANVKDGLAILVALLIELGSGFGLYAATASGSRTAAKPDRPAILPAKDETPARPQKRAAAACSNRPAQKTGTAVDPVRDFTKRHVIPKPSREIPAGDLYDAFKRWCEINHISVPSPAAFGRKLTALKFQRVKRGGAVYYSGVELGG